MEIRSTEMNEEKEISMNCMKAYIRVHVTPNILF